MTTEEAQQFAEDNEIAYMETSAVDGQNVKEAFTQLIGVVHQTRSSLVRENSMLLGPGQGRPVRPPDEQYPVKRSCYC